MAEGGDADWELCKENIQPLKGGRAIAVLNQALSLQEGFSSATNQHKQAFESELRLYDGDDPLDVWDRYVKWTEQTFPQGGKESNLSVLLERAVMRFTEENKYHNDVRYVDLWIKFAENCPEPLDVYRYMQAQGIGTMQASFYIAWSEEHEKQANYRQADTVYQEGFRCRAEPLDKLRQFHKGLQARVSRQVMTGMLEEEEEEEDASRGREQERMSLVDLKHRGKSKAVAPINRVGAALSCKSSGLPSQGEAAAGSGSNRRFKVFDENRAVSAAPAEPRVESWMAPPTSRAKENEQRPEKWSSVKMPQRSRFGHVIAAPPSEPNFKPFVEESDQPPAMTPCKINPAVNSVLSARKPCRGETPLKRLQEHSQQQQHAVQGAAQGAAQEQEKSMYCKELLLSGATEFCFEELRAERYRQRAAAEPSGREG